ncbi:MAG: hypothetical protein RL226_1853, partial [Bacteroidota bacterium]
MTNVTKSILKLFAASAFMFIAVAAGAQSKYTEKADQAFKTGQYSEAAKQYVIAYNKLKGVEEKGRVCFQIAESHRLMQDNKGAGEFYQKAIDFKFGKENPEVYYRYAETLREQNKFDEAVQQYNKYKENGGDKSKANARIKECEDAALALDQPPTRYVVEAVPVLNTEQFDFSPSWGSKKMDELIFASSRPSSTGAGEDVMSGQSTMDLFISERDKKGKWSTPVPLNN